MVFSFSFADIGEGLHEGEVLKWHVKPGDSVKKDQLVVEVLTEKVTAEIVAPVTGIIKELHFKEGEVVKVGQIMFTIDEGNSTTKETKPSTQKKEQKSEPAEKEKQVKPKDDSLFVASEKVSRKRVTDATTTGLASSQPAVSMYTARQSPGPGIINARPLAAPAIRRAAREKNIDLHNVFGTGPGGRITREDFINVITMPDTTGPSVPRLVTAPKHIVPSGTEEHLPLKGIRRAIADKMSKSKKTAAHYSYIDEFDMSNLEELRQQTNTYAQSAGLGIKVSYLPFIIKALIPALKDHPYLNATMDDEKEEIILKGYYNIGIAVDTENGLIVPVIKNADKKSIWELAREINDLAERARTGKLKLSDMTGGTFTLSNVGPIGGMISTPVINWPEVAIIGINRGKLRPVVSEQNGKPEITIRRMMYLSISIDHRVCDGAEGARFMNQFISYLENPSLLFLDKI